MHMREPAFSTSGLKSDITIVFLDPKFIGNSGDSLTYLKHKLAYIMFARIFRTFWPKMNGCFGS